MYTKYKIIPFCPCHFVRTILSNTILSVYHFVHTILSVPFCPLPFCPVTLRGASYHCIDTVSVLQPETLQATMSERLTQGPYMAARMGFEPATLRTQGTKLTTQPP